MLKAMNLNKILCSLLRTALLTITISVSSQTVQAAAFISTDTQPILLAQNGISADQAAAQVRREYGGRILSVRRIQNQGRSFYRIKVLTQEGVVRIVRIDANTGRRF